MPQKVLIKRTSTDNSPPTGLSPGELAVEMGVPTRLWVGVPTTLDPSGKKQLTPSGGTVTDIWVDTAGDTMTGPLIQSATTPSTSPTTGAITVAGGLGVGGSIYANGRVAASVVQADAAGSAAGTNVICMDSVSGRSISLAVSSGSAFNGITSNVNNLPIWEVLFGDASNAFQFKRYNAAGAPVDIPMFINWADGAVTVGNQFRVGGACYWNFNGEMLTTGQAYKPAGGPWADSSDARIKTVLGPYEHGLEQVLQLDPQWFIYKGNDTPEALPVEQRTVPYQSSPHHRVAVDSKEFVGLVAQDAQPVMPEMVTAVSGYIDGAPVDDLLRLDTNALTYALVNAVKELAARVETLEARIAQPR